MRLSGLIQLVFLLCLPFFAGAQNTTIFGTNKTYANQKIDVYTCTDYIAGINTLVGSAVADSEGNFSINMDLTATCRVTLDLGRIRGVMYVDTAMSYNIALPDFEPKNKGDLLNPYFEPFEIVLGVKSPRLSDINKYIDMFDYAYEDCVERNYLSLFKKTRQTEVDSIIDNMEKSFDTIPNEFFKTYRHYKYAWLKYVSYMRDWRYVSREYFDNCEVPYDNPAYMDLFNSMFTNFLEFYMNTREGERIFSDIVYAKSPKLAKQTLSNSLAVTNDTLQELVLLKAIHDALYGNDFPSSSLLIALDSIKETTAIERHRQIVMDVKNKWQVARAGMQAPDFCLPDTLGELRNIEGYHGKYIYLNFISIDNYACVQDLSQLKLFNDKVKNVMKVVSVSIDDNFAKTKDYFKRNGYDWELLDFKGDPSVIDRYRVKVYPAYFLIDMDGIMLMSPAAAPSENFEKRFRQIFNDRKYGRDVENK